MTAGAVSAPLIIPIIHLQTHGAKNHIDTNTPVCIQSDTPHVLIFYTLDGSNPAAAAGQRGSAGSSRKYREPILLPAGRVSLRAVAVSSDGRQSSTVTKVFSVDVVESNDRKRAEDHFLQGDGQHLTDGRSGSPENSAGSTEPSMIGNHSPQPGPRFLNSGLGSLSTATFQTGSVQRSPSASSGVLQDPTAPSPRDQRDLFLRCPQCFSFRPSDPFARFCVQCGAVVPPVPQQRPPPAEGGQVTCVSCNSVVPVNTHTCLICEASVQRHLQLQDHVVCVCCGSGNPAHISTCLTCESRLQPDVCVGDSRMSSWCRCKRINHSDARYCDWCGSTAGRAATSCAMCWRCGASRHPYAFYCATCGVQCEAPAPPTSCDITPPVSCTAPRQASATAAPSPDYAPSPDPAPVVKSAPATADQCTQTVGLYYPSATELHRKDQQRALQLSRQQSTRERQPPLTAISPGRGYWRKQLDHVYAHLRSYAQNNAPFRTLLGEPRLGRMVSAAIQEDAHEVSLTISFVSAREEPQVGPDGDAAAPAGDAVRPVGGAAPAGRTGTLSSVTERYADSSRRRTTGSSGGLTGSGRSTGLMKPPKQNLTAKPPVKDVQLLKELASDGGEIGVVQQLLDQGADPSCCGSDGRHALAVAVVNGHHAVLPVLVQRGADVDQQSGRTKNTAMHEAAALGSGGLQCAEVLLSCRASVRRRNAAGQTAYDVAVSAGCNNMASLLAARTGLDLLDQLGTGSQPGRFLTNALD